MALIDVVNFNADASCLSSSKWLRCLEGGRASLLSRVLLAYVRARRKVNLGIVGATVKDMAHFNPESIEIINEHRDVFEMVVRPFAHDNALLRLPQGFRANVEEGLSTLRRYFTNVNTFFLAPEITITGEQIRILHDLGVAGIFLHKGRYDVSVTRHVPDQPFFISGVLGTSMLCVPFADKDLEVQYLRTVHGTMSAAAWAGAARASTSAGPRAIWRDGESCLLHPLGPDYEAAALESEAAAGVERAFLSTVTPPGSEVTMPAGALRYFPLHSMRPWLDAMKLYWYIGRVQAIERDIDSLPPRVRRMWLLTVNSDILSAAEKSPPIVDVSSEVLAAPPGDFLWQGVLPVEGKRQVILTRSERAGEGEDYLAYLEMVAANQASAEEVCTRWSNAPEPHLRKAFARVCD